MEINTQETETESIIENKTEERENALVKHARHELNLILALGALPVSLGRTVLRAETASIYAASVLRFVLEI